ncbi:lipid-A-disaccharide synthase [Neorhizobium petrolearium]|uniref:Lipid-A-disaccharide synthase n=1 Tax=Neorhizobium petrolearium TaxID=515361 RepID=A0ABY8M8R4_9HYPH|nr:lipid-A-disaccharide synthase [Neorhizobium petrolearium]MCC2609921.1 lipid-A-disaccharide synthase [Neorhizobium petrolearium]WGI70104.1 lipid-A-disaccharide synthase [Neorhizobium petrolearium]
MSRALKVGVVAGEVSGDLLGGDLIAALKAAHDGPVELIGVGGDALAAQGLASLFDFSELSIMGLTQVLARLPNLIGRINQTAAAIVAARPDVLVVIDSPDFTHRVAKKVRAALPDLPIIDYVCPSVWAWKEYRATAMLAYVDHVLAVLPFEPEAMKRLGGPETTFVGHRLTDDPSLLKVRGIRAERPAKVKHEEKTILLLPGSRSAEIKALLPVFGEAAREFVARNGKARFLLPTVPRQEKLVRELAAALPVKPEITVDAESKWAAFAEADAAIAASGTVILELALSNVPVVSAYKADWLITLMSKRIKIWSGALPNLIADYPVVPEYINEVVRPGSLCRWAERLSSNTTQRYAMMEGFDLTWQRLQVPVPPGEAAAGVVLEILDKKKPGHL